MKITCNLAMDLVDVYTNCVASDETVNIVKEHLRECPACRKYYSEYKKELSAIKNDKPVFKAEFSPNLPEELLTGGIERLAKRLRMRRIARNITNAAVFVSAVALILKEFLYKKNQN